MKQKCIGPAKFLKYLFIWRLSEEINFLSFTNNIYPFLI